MNDLNRCIELLERKEKLVALLAPSFPVMYDYPKIVARLKALGFTHVIEVTAGAVRTNEAVISLLKANPEARFITSPCPGFVRLVRKSYPQLLPYLAFKADSPMIASAKIAKEKYPDCQTVFIGPCLAKKLESSEDYPDLNLLVLTYRELDSVFQKFNIGDDVDATGAAFDVAEAGTRIYPMDGGLTITSGLRDILKEEEIRIVSGYKNIPAVLEEFGKNPKIRFVDVLFCDGGCINGPGMVSTLTLEERKKKIHDFAAQVKEIKDCHSTTGITPEKAL
ncbi:MAG: [Fe-Fe] hydrogenase large subunit C-terminal domain-containing protein [Candidatus Peribacteraceae bacterium]|nr:[Fe-Fe] hydrogenase large subunit C-terminal domain-containing protein [Candidatus Peribacteraceae bacterium]MDD5074754.1 [Fe-Fe] hydrogenase large subunit C-terminal domain-containing protein [Candidatus Peribacteraceae bacterium]